MKTHGVVAVIATLLCLGGCGPSAEAPSAEAPADALSPLVGAWRVVDVRGSTASPLSDPPSLYLFTRSHYSIMRVTGPQPRPTFAAPDPTDAEKLVAFDSFIGNAGTYEVAGDTLVIRPIVAKHPNYMGGGHDRLRFRLVGDTLVLTGNSANLRYLINGQEMAPTSPASEMTYRLARLE